MTEAKQEEALRQQGLDRQSQQIIELQRRLEQVEEEKKNDAGAAQILRGWIGEGKARQGEDGSVQLI